ncbi:MAG: UDP-N-acetylglucosamine--N-acetylmuramyl-(pentapeptide) pyrophosphoryl-undecaprenol N-acetylglucosamine transferase [Calditrichaeota bacterium]|nr:UDP-N-acetylglucosamine--N-acetylmuramyl-(pentapeptide) pyrophosphoryl-undecaprenol N-acetylglucosamine transferase [Calditrichota bacterium]
MSKRILFISWQAAMGHVTRDLAIAKELHRIDAEIDISWLANPLSAKSIREAGETLLPEADRVADPNLDGLEALSDFSLDLMKYVKKVKETRVKNVQLLQQVNDSYDFDLIVGDEIYEIVIALAEKQLRLRSPVVIIEDFIGHQAMDKNLKIRLGVYLYMRKWVKAVRDTSRDVTHLFVGEPEDVENKRLGFMLPNKRTFARNHYRFLGYIVRFDPTEYKDKTKIRAKLGYGSEPLVICATGGTGAGRELLELCGKAYPILKEKISDLRMVCVCGELFGLNRPELPFEVELHDYIPNIYEHYAACDLAVVVGGGTTTIELTALRKRFLFFPLENQFDQQIYVADRIARHGAGIRMEYRRTTPELLARAITENIGKEVGSKPIPIDGAKKAAQIIAELLSGNR